MHPIETDLLPPESIRPLKRSEYGKLVGLGVFENERVELLYGRIVEMSPQKGPHATSITALAERLIVALVGRATVRVQMPLAASEDSEPEPDIAVVERADYVDDHPSAAHLVVEVTSSSRRIDLQVKAPLYASMGVPDYWVLDVERDELVVHRDPADDRYRSISTFTRGHEIAPLRFGDVAIAVDAVLPPKR